MTAPGHAAHHARRWTRRRGPWRAAGLLVAALAACSSPRVERAPADVTFSVGIVDGNPGVAVAGGVPGNGGAPQTATTVHLKFNGGTRGPFTVVAERVNRPAASGAPIDWESIPASTVPLVPAAEAVGMSKESWNTEFLAAQGYLQVWDYGIYYVRIKAAFDDRRLYLQLQWADSTQSVGRKDWLYTANAQTGAVSPVRGNNDEDVVYLSFLVNPAAAGRAASGCTTACHVNERLGATSDEDLAYRFTMHSATPGLRADSWAWYAARTNPLGLADDGYWDDVALYGDCPDPPACTQACGSGDVPPCSTPPYLTNRDSTTKLPLFMSADGINASPPSLFLAGAGSPAAAAFDALTVAPVAGATLPGYVLQPPSDHRGDVSAHGTWANGAWTLELSRDLVTSDPNDAQFPLQ
jgi:hypothetical protein